MLQEGQALEQRDQRRGSWGPPGGVAWPWMWMGMEDSAMAGGLVAGACV